MLITPWPWVRVPPPLPPLISNSIIKNMKEELSIDEKLDLITQCQAEIQKMQNSQKDIYGFLIARLDESDERVKSLVWDNVFNKSDWTIELLVDLWEGKIDSRFEE